MARLDMEALVKSYTGPKLRLLFTGVGSYASGLIGIPGSSALIDSITIPYSKESVSDVLRRLHPQAEDVIENAQSVSQEMVVALHFCNSRELRGTIPVTVTGAITTNRYRRGENHAFIALGQASVEVHHLLLDKLTEQEHVAEVVAKKRYIQDRMISEVALAMALGMQSDLVDELQKTDYLVRV